LAYVKGPGEPKVSLWTTLAFFLTSRFDYPCSGKFILDMSRVLELQDNEEAKKGYFHCRLTGLEAPKIDIFGILTRDS
jgi:hypothetical protein